MNSHDADSSPVHLSRRHALGGAAAGLAALALSGGGVALAQEATPTADSVSLLFVQSFSASTLAPTDGDPNTLSLTLEQDSGQTLYFAERPSRLVGSIDTAGFVEMFRAETAQDPANAALVGQISETDVATHVVEILELQYDPATRTATYTVRLLDDATTVTMNFRDEPEQSVTEPRSYGPSQLFIDAGGLMQLVAYGAQDVYLDGNQDESD